MGRNRCRLLTIVLVVGTVVTILFYGNLLDNDDTPTFLSVDTLFVNMSCLGSPKWRPTRRSKTYKQTLDVMKVLNSRLPILLVDVDWLTCISQKCDNLNTRAPVEVLVDSNAWHAVNMTTTKYYFPAGWSTYVNDSTAVMSYGDDERLIVRRVVQRTHYVYVDGHVPWAVLPFKTSTLSLSPTLCVHVPVNITFHLWQRSRSRFMDCRHELADNLRRAHPENYAHQTLPAHEVVDDMTVYRDFLYAHNVAPVLFGGTALGWYRECSIIPDTTDVDFAAPIEQYSAAMEHDLRWHTRLTLDTVFGMPKDSLEFAIFMHGRKMDLFFLYASETTNGSWVGGMIAHKKEKLRWTYRRRVENHTCVADLHGHLFMVACEVEMFLEDDYGDGWRVPHHNKDFVWYASHSNVHKMGTWSNADWPKVYRTKFH